jgi:hypothetical protein
MEDFLRYVEDQTKRPVKFNKYNNHTNLISMARATKMTKMSIQSLNKLVENSVLESFIQVPNDTIQFRSITVDSIGKFMEYKKSIVFKKELAESIGLNSKHINLFEENNWIKRIELFSERNKRKSYYDIRFGEQLIDRIEKNNVRWILEEQSQDSKFISFSSFFNRAASREITFIELMEELIDGSITIYKVPHKKPFKSYFFDLNDVLSFIKISRLKKFNNEIIRFNKEEVCELLKVSHYQITSWIEFGYFGTEKNTSEFSYKEVEEFANNYVTMAQLINIFKTSSNKLLARFLKKGILPVSGPIVNGGAGYIYKKSDLETVMDIVPKIDIKERVLEVISLNNKSI